MSAAPFDIAILGGGCSGLSLAGRFSKTKIASKVIILEARDNYIHDRNWSFFLKNNLLPAYSDIITKSWSSWKFSDLKEQLEHHSPDYSYVTVQSINFYHKMLALIKADSRQSLKTSTKVEAVEWLPKRNSFLISTHNERIESKVIIDTRSWPTRELLELSSYYQIFYGTEVELERDFFDDSSAQLMMNMKPLETGMAFSYILPFSKREALIEYTVFSSCYQDPLTLKESLEQCLKSLGLPEAYRVKNVECAVLPMGQVFKSCNYLGRYYSLGIRGGHLRESSGYGFLTLNQISETVISGLEKLRKVKIPKGYSPFTRLADRHFIKTIKEQPEATPEIFMALARNLSPEVFARFMNNSHSSFELLKIIWAVPKRPFLRALVSK
jgi:lycopene beta-cyclase